MRTSKRMEEVASMGKCLFLLLLLSREILLLVLQKNCTPTQLLFRIFSASAAQKRKEIAEKVKDLSEEFEVIYTKNSSHMLWFVLFASPVTYSDLIPQIMLDVFCSLAEVTERVLVIVLHLICVDYLFSSLAFRAL